LLASCRRAAAPAAPGLAAGPLVWWVTRSGMLARARARAGTATAPGRPNPRAVRGWPTRPRPGVFCLVVKAVTVSQWWAVSPSPADAVPCRSLSTTPSLWPFRSPVRNGNVLLLPRPQSVQILFFTCSTYACSWVGTLLGTVFSITRSPLIWSLLLVSSIKYC
jgi:hypothetical protein